MAFFKRKQQPALDGFEAASIAKPARPIQSGEMALVSHEDLSDSAFDREKGTLHFNYPCASNSLVRAVATEVLTVLDEHKSGTITIEACERKYNQLLDVLKFENDYSLVSINDPTINIDASRILLDYNQLLVERFPQASDRAFSGAYDIVSLTKKFHLDTIEDGQYIKALVSVLDQMQSIHDAAAGNANGLRR